MRITSTYQTYANIDSKRLAIVTEEESVTYGEWYDGVQRTAASFFRENQGTKRVALFLPNGRLFLQLFAGACEAGWASIVGDMRWKKQEIEERLEQTSPDLIFADARLKVFFQNYQGHVIYADEIEEWIGQMLLILKMTKMFHFILALLLVQLGNQKPLFDHILPGLKVFAVIKSILG